MDEKANRGAKGIFHSRKATPKAVRQDTLALVLALLAPDVSPNFTRLFRDVVKLYAARAELAERRVEELEEELAVLKQAEKK